MLFKNATIYTMEEEPFIGDFRVGEHFQKTSSQINRYRFTGQFEISAG